MTAPVTEIEIRRTVIAGGMIVITRRLFDRYALRPYIVTVLRDGRERASFDFSCAASAAWCHDQLSRRDQLAAKKEEPRTGA